MFLNEPMVASVSMRWASLVGVLAIIFTATASSAQFPREGIADVPNGVAAPFVGAWSVGFPNVDGAINGEPIVTCAEPVRLEAGRDGTVLYHSPTGQSASFELLEFSGRTTWLPENTQSSIAVWTSQDSFLLYRTDIMTGAAYWDDPRAYDRCPSR